MVLSSCTSLRRSIGRGCSVRLHQRDGIVHERDNLGIGLHSGV